MKRPQILPVLAALLTLVACDDDNPESELRYPTVAVFAPSRGDIPVPNDLLFAGSLDGTLNLPVADPLDLSDPLVALNAIDGWSTTAPFVIRFSRNVDLDTVVAGVSVRVFDVATLTTPMLPVGGPVLAINSELAAGADYHIEPAAEYPGTSAIRVVLEQALVASTLAEKKSYMVVVTKAIRDAEGFAVSEDQEYFIATSDVPFDASNPATAQLAQLQQILSAMEFVAESGAGIDRSSIALAFSFSTQSTRPTLDSTRRIAQGDEPALISEVCALLPPGSCMDTTVSGLTPFTAVNAFSGATTAALLPGSPGFADLHVGQITLPYYQTSAPNASFSGVVQDPTPLENHWRARYPDSGPQRAHLTRFNPLPVATGVETVPLLVLRPNAASMRTVPVGGWPVVIFQHGITRNRADALFVADRLAAAGFVVISMDLPLHGLDTANVFAQLFLGYVSGQLRERTFGLDLADNATGAPGPDGIADPSGLHFLNLTNLLNSRDNLRQAVSDLFNLRATIGTFTVAGEPLDNGNVHFLGHSLGGIVGLPFAALDGGLETAAFSAIGGGIPYLLDESPTYGPVLQAGLAAAGVAAGTPDYSSFLFAAQTIVDSGDPINYVDPLLATGMPQLHNLVVGGGPGGGLPDQVVPNSVRGRPLSGSEGLVEALGLPRITATTNGSGVVRFIEGYHGSLLAPQDPFNPDPFELAATAEMQSQVTGYFGSYVQSGGTQTTITITDPSVIDTAP